MRRLRPTRRPRQRPWIPWTPLRIPGTLNLSCTRILYDRLARFYSRDITNTSPPWPITYNLYLSTDGATVENGPAHAPYPPCHGKEAKPRSVTMDLLTCHDRPRQTVGAYMHTSHLPLAAPPADRRRQTQGLHPTYTLQRTALSHDLITSIPSDRRRKHAHLRRRRFHHDPTRTRAPNPNPKWSPQILPSPPQPPTRQ